MNCFILFCFFQGYDLFPPLSCFEPVGIKGGGRSTEPSHFLRKGEGTEARRRAGKRPDLPKLSHCGSRGGGDSGGAGGGGGGGGCLLYTSPSPRDRQKSRMASSA